MALWVSFSVAEHLVVVVPVLTSGNPSGDGHIDGLIAVPEAGDLLERRCSAEFVAASMARLCPVTHADSGPAKKRTPAAMSSGVPVRPRGFWLLNSSRISGSENNAETLLLAVLVSPGRTALTRMA